MHTFPLSPSPCSSITQGICAGGIHNTWPYLIEETLPPDWRIVNMGIAAKKYASTDDENLISRFGNETDILIVALGINHFNDNGLTFQV